jgi:hypothetical protein
MKIRGMEIARWRNVPDLTIEPDADTDFICLVGVNGVGKSKSAGADRLASSQLASARNRCRKWPLPFQRREPFDDRRKPHLKAGIDRSYGAPGMSSPGSARPRCQQRRT